MNGDERWFQGHLRELDEAECWELLSAREVGRVAYLDARGPMVVPVTFTPGEDSLLFRVAPYSELARHLPGAQAALEVDELDYFNRTGWSVVVRGRIDALDNEELPPTQARPTPWPEGQRSLYLRLAAEQVTGRRLIGA